MVSGVRRMAARKRSSTPVSAVTAGMTAWIWRSTAGAASALQRLVSEISA